jgi:hypothetical protein
MGRRIHLLLLRLFALLPVVEVVVLRAGRRQDANGRREEEEVEGEAGSWWSPRISGDGLISWQWQLQGEIDTSLDVQAYDVDLFDASQTVIDELHSSGRIVICYFSAGTYEGWRSDWKEYFPFITDEKYGGNEPPFAGRLADWDERWLDVRRIDLLGPIMTSRLELAVSKNCDAVEPDNVDAYQNSAETGLLDLTAEDQLAYNRWIADQAHGVGLSVGLKNDVDQLQDLVDWYDWALNEQCFEYDECEAYGAFTNRDKVVLGVEYSGWLCRFCPQARTMQLSWMKKRPELGPWRRGCEDRLTRILCWCSFLFERLFRA